MPDIAEFRTTVGLSPFAEWFETLDSQAARRVKIAVTRMEMGNLGDVKSVGDGVLERRLDFGPGYRLYFGREGDELIILLCGGTKKRQQRDIDQAKVYWCEYKERKKQDGD